MSTIRQLLPNGNYQLLTTLSPEDYAELKLSLFDASCDSMNGQPTTRGRDALYRILGPFPACAGTRGGGQFTERTYMTYKSHKKSP